MKQPSCLRNSIRFEGRSTSMALTRLKSVSLSEVPGDIRNTAATARSVDVSEPAAEAKRLVSASTCNVFKDLIVPLALSAHGIPPHTGPASFRFAHADPGACDQAGKESRGHLDPSRTCPYLRRCLTHTKQLCGNKRRVCAGPYTSRHMVRPAKRCFKVQRMRV